MTTIRTLTNETMSTCATEFPSMRNNASEYENGLKSTIQLVFSVSFIACALLLGAMVVYMCMKIRKKNKILFSPVPELPSYRNLRCNPLSQVLREIEAHKPADRLYEKLAVRQPSHHVNSHDPHKFANPVCLENAFDKEVYL
ncbi:hypothetical protein VCUG_01712 [Vavraia culicis subsp. floridensis]|uniref:Uncharacterized protein n=1 Tax=Vavraia culicis (isolate floridensis) TaxID=948595 RepID=L2GTY3_VAVCU|nr:uncharacterized protein VCUG_01712 [Vavraia culicis subsp. floridensis]ELA46812.1 hypothetical protein VCUG_01712 [Vavraia culicis subsp. floridensis]